MPTIKQTYKFQKQAAKLDPKIRKQLNAKLLVFEASRYHPGLHIEKLGGSDLHSFRVNQNFRVIFRQLKNNIAELIFIASHDVYRKIKNI